MILFVDTNFFLQCNNYNQVNWSDITSDELIELYIARPVQEEIDKLKNDGNSRRAKRARNTNSFFRKILLSENLILNDNIGDIKIVFRFADNYTREQLLSTGKKLDLSRPDDEIIASLIKFIQDTKAENAFLLTHDTNPILTAKSNNIPVKIIPDNWLLSPESDDRDKKIKHLEDELKKAKAKEPLIICSFKIDSLLLDDRPISLEFKKFNDLHQSELEYLLGVFQKRYPLKANFSDELEKKDPEIILPRSLSPFHNIRKEYIPPTANEIEKYMNELYPHWVGELRKYFENYPKSKNYYERIKQFSFSIQNDGSAPVENLILEFKVIKGALIAPPNFEELIESYSTGNPPKAPEAPKGHWKIIENSMFSALNSIKNSMEAIPPNFDREILSAPIIPKPHDRYGFYWEDDKPSVEQSVWIYLCDEFRHKSAPELFNYYFMFNETGDDEKFVFQVSISGSNLSEPIVKTYIAKISYDEENVKEEILQMLDE